MFKCWTCGRMELIDFSKQHMQNCAGFVQYVQTEKERILSEISQNIKENTQAINNLTEVMRTRRW